MPKQALQYQLAELRPEDFMVVPSLNIAISKAKARASDDKVLTSISWYGTKMLTQSLGSNYLLPTSSQWSKSREYLQQNYPELEKDFITGEVEWVDSLLAFPNQERQYSPRLQLSGIKKGKVPLLIEQSKVERSGDSYVLKEGKITEVPELPLKNGYIQDWNDDLGLPTKVGKNPNERFEGAYFWVNTNYGYHEGLRALVRGRWGWGGREGRFLTPAGWLPSASDSLVGFRLVRTSNADDFVRMPRAEYEALIKQKEMINNGMAIISSSMENLDKLLSKARF